MAENLNTDTRKEKLKAYLKRLGEGEALESVRADFAENFSQVDAGEIMRAEQELLKEGTPLAEVQKLCDVHSALFHGATGYDRKQEITAELIRQPGHPLETFTMENRAFEQLLEEGKEAIARGQVDSKLLDRVREIAIHYAKKGDLLYPHLKVKYGILGPSDVMWTVDDEIRDELAALSKADKQDEEWLNRFSAVLKRAEEMIYKEDHIFFPNCAVNFTEDDWKQIYRDSKDYAVCLGVPKGIWDEAEKKEEKETEAPDDGNANHEIAMPGGHMTVEQLTALLNTIPLEITFVDDENINRFFNEGPKVFKRPGMAIDREVFSCHPPKVEVMVRAIIDDLKTGKRDCVPVWMDKNGRTVLVTYMAVRDKTNHYLGTVELVQDMEFAKEHFQK